MSTSTVVRDQIAGQPAKEPDGTEHLQQQQEHLEARMMRRVAELVLQHADDAVTVLREHGDARRARHRVEANEPLVVLQGELLAAHQRDRFLAGHRVHDLEDPVEVGRGREPERHIVHRPIIADPRVREPSEVRFSQRAPKRGCYKSSTRGLGLESEPSETPRSEGAGATPATRSIVLSHIVGRLAFRLGRNLATASCTGSRPSRPRHCRTSRDSLVSCGGIQLTFVVPARSSRQAQSITRSALPAPPDGPSADVHACASGRRSCRSRTARRPRRPTAHAASERAVEAVVLTGHSRQNALAAAMSSSCSEKNSSVIDPLPSLQRARSCQSGSRLVSSVFDWLDGEHRQSLPCSRRSRAVSSSCPRSEGAVRSLSGSVVGQNKKGRRVAPTAWWLLPV